MAILLAALLLVQMPATDAVEPSLIGVVVSHDPDRSVAILRAAGRTRVVRPGEQAFGGRVLAVEVATGRIPRLLGGESPESVGCTWLIGDYRISIVGILLLGSTMVVVFNLVADVLYGIMDPRIRYE